MVKIYHNPRCSKSREGLAILEKSGEDFEVVLYLEDIPSRAEIKKLLGQLRISPEKLIRKNEAVWKERFKGKNLSDDELIEAMVAYPKLIERPIVVKDNKAVLGRPPELITQLLK